MPTTREPPNPAASKVLTEERRAGIGLLLAERGAVSSEDLADRYNVTHMTIYRDLKALEARGILRMVRGGAIRPEGPAGQEPQYGAKRHVNQAAKERIAMLAAARFIADEDIIILEGGTTVSSLVKHITARNVTVVTNGLETLNETTPYLQHLHVISCGGLLRAVSHTLVGPQTQSFFSTLSAHTFFLGATGLTPQAVTDQNLLEIQVKQAMIQAAQRTVLLIDSSKFGTRSLAPVIATGRLHAIVTDGGAPRSDLKAIEEQGVLVLVAE
ncbi:MAG TPA: DeoR/GlpR family DNA-binding transcription regulator [Deinococcales bacterium]|nr:DeoR/GlpR family DNA-binding transcription regulator [Deinococcales bacterium]